MKGFFTLVICFCSLGTIHVQQYQPADDKSTVTFTVRNFGVNTSGTFKGLAGTIEFDKTNPEKAVFNISVQATTVNTDNSTRDNHLRKEEYFDTEKFPEVRFTADKVTSRGNGFSVSGKLTIKGTTKNISFPFTASPAEDGLLFEGHFEINRLDFKVGGSSMVLGDKVTVKLSVAAKKK